MGISAAIDDHSQVTLYFELKLTDGSVIHSNFSVSPATFKMGDGSLLPGFEGVLRGLQKGDKQTFSITAENAFGLHSEDHVKTIPRQRFGADLELAVGLVISFSHQGASQLPGVVKTFDDYKVTVDFNHPLAGKTIIFRVAIITVNNSD